MTIWFTSDTHYGHANIIEYCKRPFANTAEMNKVMAERWNARVKPGDTVYHLGDFALGPGEDLDAHRKQLAGRIVLVKGNHDRSTTRMLTAGFDEVVPELFLALEGTQLYLHHQPRLSPFWGAKAQLHLCGHVHNQWARQDDTINVGVDVRDFEPKTLGELLGRSS